MTLFAAVLAAVCFAAVLRLLRVFAIAAGAVSTARGAASTMKDARLSDAEKEQFLQKASVSLLRTFASIVTRSTAASLVSLFLLLLLHAGGVADMSAVAAALVTWPGVVLSGAAATAASIVKM